MRDEVLMNKYLCSTYIIVTVSRKKTAYGNDCMQRDLLLPLNIRSVLLFLLKHEAHSGFVFLCFTAFSLKDVYGNYNPTKCQDNAWFYSS